LNFNEYLPSFSSFDINNLFKHELNKIINYDFSFIDNSLTQLMKENDPLTIETKRVNCCLVKKHYHVKGEIIIIERGKNANNHFEIIFCSNSDNNGNTCNKIKKENVSNENKIINSNNNEICYGSIFPCLKKEFNRKILIKSKDIKFILIRNYYRRTSAIEIFTYKSNKSYYFNFHKFIDLNNNKDNKLLKAFNDYKYFKKFNFHKIIGGYYNKKYENLMFPLFSEQVNDWKSKVYFFRICKI
jgi:hypothetical protein